MAELSFTKEGSKYVCEFEVSSDFNLHLERDKGGFLFLYQRSSDGGSYDSVGDAKFAPHDSIIDYDCTALVYPKFIKIVSEVEPTYAAITTDGEVTEIKAQSKEIEVTSNGTTNVTPDSGFAYLSNVKVKTNVPTSGGGSADTMEYFILKDAGEYDEALFDVASYHKIQLADPSMTSIAPYTGLTRSLINDMEFPIAVGVDFNSKILLLQDDTITEMTMMDYFSQMGAPTDGIANIPRITKEEFFTLPKDVTVKYRDQEKLKEVYEGIVDLYIRRGLPIYGKTREAMELEEPIIYFNYRFLGIEYNEFGDMYTPTHLSMYGIGQQGYPENDWDESFSESEDISHDYLEFSDCYIFKVTLPNGEVVYTFKGKLI